jgi:hypothetical protein
LQLDADDDDTGFTGAAADAGFGDLGISLGAGFHEDGSPFVGINNPTAEERSASTIFGRGRDGDK